MNAIIRHRNSGEHFLATLDESGDVERLSAVLPIADTLGRDWSPENMTETEWEQFGYADVEPFEDEEDRIKHWSGDQIAVVHTF